MELRKCGALDYSAFQGKSHLGLDAQMALKASSQGYGIICLSRDYLGLSRDHIGIMWDDIRDRGLWEPGRGVDLSKSGIGVSGGHSKAG